MKPWRLPSAHSRVPTTNMPSGMMSADDDAINPYVTMPFEKAWPDAPRIENAVMFVPKSDSRKTAGSERAAGEEVTPRRRACPVGRARAQQADAEHDGQIHENDDRRNQWRGSSVCVRGRSSRCDGQ